MSRKTTAKSSKEKAHIMNQKEISRAKNFEEATEAYKAIFTDNGINPDGLVQLVINCINLCDDDYQKSLLAHNVCLQAVIFGSYNYYEAIGILEAVKEDYREFWLNTMQDNKE